MVRILFILLGVALLAALLADPALAAAGDRWPIYPLRGHQLTRGPGGYLSIVKLGLCIGLFFVWVKTTDWVSQDCRVSGMPYALWNPIVFFPFLAGFFLFALSVPLFFVGYPLFLLSYGVPLGVYIVRRNSIVQPHQKVLTREHIRFLIATSIQRFGGKMDAEKKADHEKGPPVNFTAMGGKNQQEDTGNLLTARQSPGYVWAKEIISDALGHRADKIMLDYSKDKVGIRHQIDGVWHNVEPLERESGDVTLAVMKTLAALDPNQRRARQEGKFGVVVEVEAEAEAEAKAKAENYTCAITSQGTKTGERVVLQLIGKEIQFESLEELGMRNKMQKQLKKLLGSDRGLVLFSSLPAGGLTTTFTMALKATDRFVRDFYAVEDAAKPAPDVENIEVVTYDAAAGQTPDALMPQLLRREPNVLVVRDLVNVEMVKILSEVAADDKLVISSVRAKEAVEALLRVLMLKIPPSQFAPAVTAVVNQRLIRKLCETCKEAYAPNPELLKKLNLPPERVKALYRPPQPPEDPKEICSDCRGIGYRGRTSIFELLVVDDSLREAIVKKPKVETLRAVAKKAGNRSLQEEGLILVARGVTSLPELQRILKQ